MLDQILSCRELNRDLARISDWAFQWKMSFNPDPSKQAVEVYFSRRHVPANAPPLSFNNINIETNEYQKHLGLTLDSKLSFRHHLDEKIRKANKGTVFALLINFANMYQENICLHYINLISNRI